MTEDQTRDRILDAAEKLFAEKGFDAVSVREITSAAKTHLSAVNYHFGSKKDLYLEVFRSRWLERARMVRRPFEALEHQDGLSPGTIIRTLAKTSLENPLTVEERLRHGQLIIRELAKPGEALDLVFEAHIQPTLELINRLLSGALGREVDPERMMLYSLSLGALVLYFTGAQTAVSRLIGREYDPEFISRLVDHITDFALSGLGLEGAECS